MPFCAFISSLGGDSGCEVKDSLDHVAAVATTMDQTGVVLDSVEVRIISPSLPSCLHSNQGVDWEMNLCFNVEKLRKNHSQRPLFVSPLRSKPSFPAGLL